MNKPDMFSLKGKVALVTGGARGIGKVVAEHMAGVGADIVVMDLAGSAHRETAMSIAKEYGVETTSLVCDVSKPDEVAAAIDETEKQMGTPDILFNNAGTGVLDSALDAKPEDWEHVIDVNLNGVFYVAQAFAKHLIARNKGGSIINTASMSGIIVNIPQGQASYNASKAGVIHLTRTLAVEWADKNIRVNSISPGYIATDMIKNVDPKRKDYWCSLIPFGRMGKPDELAGAVIYLASDASSYTTGSNIVIDGGYTIV